MKRAAIAAGLALLLVAGGGAWWWHNRTIEGGPIVLTGNVEVRQVNLGFKVAGRIQGLKVDEGDSVIEGRLLAQLEKVYFEDSVAQLTAQRDQAKANLAKMEAGNRPEDIVQAEAAVKEKEATLANAKIAFDRAEQLLEECGRNAEGLRRCPGNPPRGRSAPQLGARGAAADARRLPDRGHRRGARPIG